MNELKAVKRAWLVRLKDRDLYCALCGCLIESRKDLTVEHLKPRAKGGTTDSANCVPAHAWCNSCKQDHTQEYWEHHGYTLLANLVNAWNQHRVRFNVVKVYKSLEALR